VIATTSHKHSPATLSELRAVLFDMDGTIIKNSYPFPQAKAEILTTLRSRGLDVPEDIYGSIANLLEKLKEVQYNDHTNIRDVILSILTKYDFECTSGARLHRGALGTLRRLKQDGYRLGLISNSNLLVVRKVLGATRVYSLFDVVVTREGVERMKPYPDMVFAACEKLGIHPSNTLVVGDSWVDIEAGFAAGAKTVYINAKNADIPQHPTYEIRKITELLKILGVNGRPATGEVTI
jgi:HAD superfamily hydrolase (TIGR01509 family)